MLSLNDREWKEFTFAEANVVCKNSKAFHIYSLTNDPKGIAYITRTSKNNGLSFTVNKMKYKLNPANTLTFGAENADFFFQPFKYITGNKMYYLKNNNFNKYSWLFFKVVVAKSTANSFSYGYGMIPKRLLKKRFLLPINEQGQLDYGFMENYVRERETSKKQEYLDYVKEKIVKLEYKEIPTLEEKEWKEYFIGGDEGLFVIKAGKRLTTADMDLGKTPFIGSTDSNNGITNWIKTINSTLDRNVLGVNYNGSVVESFYHNYECVFSDDVKRLHLKNISDNKYVLLFFSTIIKQQKIKYTYGYKFNGYRMARQKILVPINEQGQPDYEYMEQYIKNMMLNKYNLYLEYSNKSHN